MFLKNIADGLDFVGDIFLEALEKLPWPVTLCGTAAVQLSIFFDSSALSSFGFVAGGAIVFANAAACVGALGSKIASACLEEMCDKRQRKSLTLKPGPALRADSKSSLIRKVSGFFMRSASVKANKTQRASADAVVSNPKAGA